MQQLEPLPNANYEESQYYSNDKEKYKYSSNDNNYATINPNNPNHPSLTMINNQAHIYHAQDNVCDELTLPTTHNYNTKNIPISNNTAPHSVCLHTTMKVPNTNNYQPSSTITVEQR